LLLEAMVDILNHPRVYSFFHMPVQCGSNKVLDKNEVCDFLKEIVPNMTLATDIIRSFSTETDEDFVETMNLVEKYK
jgi:threonylcarbamoyladenosine tRNA methylthiotransferase CDKAL1